MSARAPREDSEFLMRPAELVVPIKTLFGMAKADASAREMMPAFSAIKAAFGATIETRMMSRRRDIGEPLEVHDRILRRVDMRPDRSAASATTMRSRPWASRDDRTPPRCETGYTFRINQLALTGDFDRHRPFQGGGRRHGAFRNF
jgi:hypothetical protein